jgi:hypothetical protein
MTGELPSTGTPAPAPPPPSAPSPSPTPAPSPSPAENKPTSFADALAREDAAAGSAPAQNPPAFREPDAFQPALATQEQTQPPAEAAPVPDTPVPGEPPQERWPQILENARKKEREQLSQQWGPALQVIQKLNTDLPGTVSQLIREGLASPQHREGLRAELGRLFGSLRAQQQQAHAALPPAPATDAEPQRYVEVDGVQYFDPQADAKWQQWRERQLDKRYEEKFKPAMSLAEQVQKAQQLAQFQAQSQQTVTERLKHWKEQPGFEQHKKAIGVKQQELYNSGLDEWTALGLAYAPTSSRPRKKPRIVAPPRNSTSMPARWRTC